MDGNVSDTIDYGEVNDSLVMKYISCPKVLLTHFLTKAIQFICMRMSINWNFLVSTMKSITGGW